MRHLTGLSRSVLILGLSVSTGAISPLHGQTDPKNTELPRMGAFSSHVTLPRKPELERVLQAIPDCIQAKDWEEAARALQAVLDAREDGFLPREGKNGIQWVSARAEAERLLSTLPPHGRQTYEVLVGDRAQELVKLARETGDVVKLAEAARRYGSTRAGREAMVLLGTFYLDRGQHLLAGVCFTRLLRGPEVDQLPAVALFKAALACRWGGDLDRGEQAWNLLTKKAPAGLVLGQRQASLEELRQFIDQSVQQGPDPAGAANWRLFRGDLARNALSIPREGEFKDLIRRWSTSTAESPFARDWLDTAVRIQDRSQPVLGGAVPLAAGGKALFRTQRGIRAVDLATGTLAWEALLTGGLDNLMDDSYPYVSDWVGHYLQSSPGMLLENASLGTLSSDDRRVFAVEDLAVPPALPSHSGRAVRGVFQSAADPVNAVMAPDLAMAVKHNQLVAINLRTGKVEWVAGSPEGKKAGLRGVYFLGPPLPLDSRLYALVEKDGEVRLICLDSTRGDLLWSQPLVAARSTLAANPGRRIWSAPLAHDQGLLVCPSNAGAVVAVDLLTRSLVWAHPYLEEPKAMEMPEGVPAGRRGWGAIRLAPPQLLATWKAAGPILAGGKVLLSTPDAPALHCLDLRSGRLLWKVERQGEEQYVAGVFQNKVVVVGQTYAQALNLKDGQLLWRSQTGTPSGQGLLAGNRLYLPLRARPAQDSPAILALNLDNGDIVHQLELPNKETPGNLVLAGDALLSQTPTTMTAYFRKK